ncbi:MAG: hypothetical protein WCF44_07240 [Candidatus Methylophosphatis roskildensis]
MNSIVIEHVPVAELPQAWRDRLGEADNGRVTVRIEAEASAGEMQDAAQFADDPLFGMWRDRADMADVGGYVRRIREPRFDGDRGRS